MNSWWADAWRTLISDRLPFDDATRRSGRTLARRLDRSTLELEPGSIVLRLSARGSDDDRSITARWNVAPLRVDQRAVAGELAAAEPALGAGVLLGELPAALDQRWRNAGVSLVPEPSDLSLDCTCDDWGDGCRHLVALGHLVAGAVEADPWVLLMLRGWSRDAFVEVVRRRRARAVGQTVVVSNEPRGDDPGVAAHERFARVPAPLPAQRPVPRRPGRPLPLPQAPADAGIDPSDLQRLIADVAARATAMLGEGAGAALHLTADADLARIAADSLDTPTVVDRLAADGGVDPIELERRATAWRVGGADGLDIADRSWQPDPEQLEPGRRVLGDRARVSANAVVAGRVQLRLDRSGRWWRFRADDRLGWVLEAGGFAEPAELS